MREAEVIGKRMVLARCKKCGRIYWYFSDVDDWKTFEERLRNHLLYAHVRKGEMTVKDIERPQLWFDMIWYRVYDPSKLKKMTPEQYEARWPEFLNIYDYEQLKLLALTYPPAFIEIAKRLSKY